MHAYDETYLRDGMENLGEAMDYAVHICKLDLDDFFAMFVSSGIAHHFGTANPKYISGMSGTELVLEVLRKSGIRDVDGKSWTAYDRSPEYWCGWSLAYFQWYTGRIFESIRECMTMSEILALYPTLHEAPEEKFVEVVNRMIAEKHLPTRLQTRRKQAGLTQSALSEKAQVNLRTLQQYEMRGKDVNKAAGETLRRLSQTLHCRMEDLLEYNELPCFPDFKIDRGEAQKIQPRDLF